MKEFSFTLPWMNSRGVIKKEVHEELKEVLCETFGGFTLAWSQCGYLDHATGEPIYEGVVRYFVALDENSRSMREGFYSVAEYYAKQMEQYSVYTVDGDGLVMIIELGANNNLPLLQNAYDKEADYPLSKAKEERDAANGPWPDKC